jgi:amidohydrolase
MIDMTRRLASAIAALLAVSAHPAGAAITEDQLDQAAKSIAPQVITWRRDFHQHPELGNRESRTSAAVAA